MLSAWRTFARAWQKYAQSRDELYRLLRNTKWFIGISLVISGLLYFPGQLRELYRSIVANVASTAFRAPDPLLYQTGSISAGEIDAGKFALSLLLIALLIAAGAGQVTTASLSATQRPSRFVQAVARILPALLGTLPLISSAWALLVSVPQRIDVADLAEMNVGNQWLRLSHELSGDVVFGLYVSAALMALCSVLFFFAIWSWDGSHRALMRRANEIYFSDWRFLLLTITIIAGITICFVAAPVTLPQMLGPFPILFLFVLCVVAFTVHFSLLTIRHRFPYISGALLLALLWAALDWTDNHTVRTVANPDRARVAAAAEASVGEQFERWFENRVDQQDFEDEYPVYIVTAQGGGIYAAYHAAIFLARMQDYCPAFAHHLFAISAVSGGSVGAATFAAALQHARPAMAPPPRAVQPCPRISEFLLGERRKGDDGLVRLGDLEPRVKKILSADLLSPLFAATLFPDFSQRFIPVASAMLDRVRGFELALEQAFLRGLPDAATSNQFSRSFLSHWNPAGDVPALLFNATDAGSGRRVLMAPFGVSPALNGHCLPGKNTRTSSVLHFQALEQPLAGSESALDIPLSTAAVVSARFPWVTPAASVPVKQQDQFGEYEKIRLVDGGYVDNSGVETALDLIECLNPVARTFADKAQRNQTFGEQKPYRRLRFHLIVLSGGDFPVRESVAVGETMEPIRTMLSTRSSRSYLAIERADRNLLPYRIKDVDDITAPVLKRVSLDNHFYALPLGWTMSDRTRSIISRQSGQFLDCDPKRDFTQKLAQQAANADCVQFLIYHELSRTLNDAARYVAAADRVRMVGGEYKRASARFDHQGAMRCYAENVVLREGGKAGWPIGPREAGAFEKLLDVWDEHPSWKDDRWLAYIVGTVMFETGHLRYWHEPLLKTSADEIWRKWQKYFVNREEAATFVNQPRRFANRIYANRYGNGDEQSEDGWRYRGRGMIHLVSRYNYRHYRFERLDLEKEPDLILVPIISARIVFRMVYVSDTESSLADHFNAEWEDWLSARRAFLLQPRERKIRLLRELGNDDAADVKRYSQTFLQCLQAKGAPQTTVAATR